MDEVIQRKLTAEESAALTKRAREAIAKIQPPPEARRIIPADAQSIAKSIIHGHERPRPQAAPPRKRFAPGSLVAIVLKQMGVKRFACGRCAAQRELMDKKGWWWCYRHRRELMAWFAEEARREGLDCPDDKILDLLKAGIEQVIKSRRDRKAGENDVILNCDSHGFGDAVIAAWIAEGSKTAEKKLVLHATGARKEFLELLGQSVVDDADHAIDISIPLGLVETMVEHGSVPRLQSRAAALRIIAEPKRPMAVIPPEAERFAEMVMPLPTILLFPQVEQLSRQWPIASWIDLAWMLEKKKLKNLTVLMRRDARFNGMPTAIVDQPWMNVAAMIRRARLIIGNDSGPAHMAGTLDVPTLALLGPTKPTAFAHLPSVHCVSLAKEQLPCVGCHFTGEYRSACDQQCRALMMLQPQQVLQEVRSILARPHSPPTIGHGPGGGSSSSAGPAAAPAGGGASGPGQADHPAGS
jgi:heptosyltransferase-1